MTRVSDGVEIEVVARKSLYRRKRVIIPLLSMVIVAAAVFAYWYLYLRGYISTDDAFVDGDAITISSKILGRVRALTADEGDSVSPGQLLVQLDDSDLLAQKAQATAAFQYTQQSVPVAKINLDRAEDDFKRTSMQFNDGVITREQFDHARQAQELARAQYQVAQSQVKSSEAQLAVIETQLSHTRVEATSPGIVARKWVMVGDVVQAGQPIFTIFDLDSVWVTANFEETKLGSINLGDRVDISVDAYPDRSVAGKVAFIGAAAASKFSLIPPNNASGNFTKVTQRVPVKITIDPDAPISKAAHMTLRPGMSVEVKILTKVK